MGIRYALIQVVCCMAVLCGAANGQTSDYPNKPVRIVVPFPPGATPDAMARLIGARLSDQWGQQIVIENRLGAGGNIAYAGVAAAPADGYTLLLASTGIATNVSLYANLPYDPLRDFTPITLVSTATHILVAHASVPAKTVKELIAVAKSKPGALTFGSSGSGTILHLAGELFKVQTGTNLLHVPYKGVAFALTDLLGGRIQLMFTDVAPVLQHVKSGRLLALGVTAGKRTPALPEVPSIAEAGVPGYDIISWFGLLAPARTPKAITDKVHKDVAAILNDPVLRAANSATGVELVGDRPEEFAAFLKAEVGNMAKVIKASGARAD